MSNTDRSASTTPIQPIIVIAIILVPLVSLGFVFGLVLAGRPVDDFMTSVILIAAPTVTGLVAVLSTSKIQQQVKQNAETLEQVANTTNGKNDRLLNDKLLLEAQLSALGHTPITHADAVSAENKGKHHG